jgi:hypothetical protein
MHNDARPFSAQLFEKIDTASAKGAPVILSWEFAYGLRNELEAVARMVAGACRLYHDWRRAPAGDYTTPHQICRHCGNARPTPAPTGDTK